MDFLTENDVLALTCLEDTYFFARRFFMEVNKKKWQRNWHFDVIGGKLDSVFRGEHPTNNIMFNMPPRSGKTELSIINFIAKGFAINPASQFIHLSTSDSLVTRNVTNIRNIMESELYRTIFPSVQLSNNAKGSITTTKGGVLYSAPFLGQITGFGCGQLGADKFAGALVVDDPMKTQDALSETVREKYNFTWANTIISRKNDERTPVIITAQRVHEHDLCGMLIDSEGTIEEGGKWDVVKFPAIVDDGLETERSMWELRYSLEYLHHQRELDKWVFDTQYMQNPRPIEGLMFPEGETHYFERAPENPEFIFIQVDPADTGNDKYCSKVYYVKDGEVYIVDTIYTPDSAELTIPRQIEQIKRWHPSYVRIESNAAWRLMAKEIKDRVIELKLNTEVLRYNQSQNKEVRIFNEAPTIRKFHYLHPSLQNREYSLCMKDRHAYLKMVKNQVDDGVDVDAAASFFLKKNGLIEKL